jgi:hypothetical protein
VWLFLHVLHPPDLRAASSPAIKMSRIKHLTIGTTKNLKPVGRWRFALTQQHPHLWGLRYCVYIIIFIYDSLCTLSHWQPFCQKDTLCYLSSYFNYQFWATEWGLTLCTVCKCCNIWRVNPVCKHFKLPDSASDLFGHTVFNHWSSGGWRYHLGLTLYCTYIWYVNTVIFEGLTLYVNTLINLILTVIFFGLTVFKGIVLWDIDGLFMILSYCLDVGTFPLDILFF